jgi:hypothetical protein
VWLGEAVIDDPGDLQTTTETWKRRAEATTSRSARPAKIGEARRRSRVGSCLGARIAVQGRADI